MKESLEGRTLIGSMVCLPIQYGSTEKYSGTLRNRIERRSRRIEESWDEVTVERHIW